MKKFRKVFILFTLAFSLIATSCDGLFGEKDEPETTEKTFTPADVNDENFPKDEEGKPIQFPEGTTIEFKKVEGEEKTTTDYTVSEPDGTTIVFHEEEEMKESKSGKMITTVTSTNTTTFSETDTSGKKSEVVEIDVTDEFSDTKGEVKEITTTTEFKDGTKEVSTKNTEGKTGNFTESIVATDKNGNKTASEEIEHTEIPEADQKWTDDGMKISSTKVSVKITYDDQGKEAKKVVTETTNPGLNGFFNKQVQTEYNYVNGEPVETKRTEHSKQGRDEKRVTESQTDGTKKITITVNDLNYPNISLGTGSGTTDTNGVTTITINYTNGIDLTTVEDKDTVTKEILLTDYGTKKYYEKTVTEKGVLTSKECEYLYATGIIFKTVTTYSNETETRKSGRFIKEGTRTLANYNDGNVEVPGNNGIYGRTENIKISADGHNEEAYTVFKTTVWDGPSSSYKDTEYPYDTSVDMTNLHLLDEE